MVNEQVIEWLPQNDWIIECESAEKVDWLLQACEEAGIKCRSGRRATKFKPNAKKYPIIIIYCAEDKTIHQGMESKTGTLVPFFVKKMGYENITDWFFNAIKGETIVINEQLIEQVIERLKESCWYVVCNSTAEVNLILQFCEKAGIGWRTGDDATKFNPNETYPLCIIFCNYDQYIMYVEGDSGDYSEKNGYENITSWIFNVIRGENNG